MKAVIVEIRGKNAAALCDDGCIIKVKDKDYAVGQVIEHRADNNYLKFAARIACVIAALAMTTTSAWAYYTPYSYVSLDVTNPSLAFSVNRFDRVLRCTALNGDGENIVSNLNLKNKSIEEAVKMTIQEIAAEGYLSDEEPEEAVIATASADLNKSHQLARELNQTAAQAAAEKNVKIETRANSVGQKSVQKAKELGTTPGRLNLVRELKESTGDASKINTEEWVKKPVKDIMQQIKQNRQENFSAGFPGPMNPWHPAPVNNQFPYYPGQQSWPWLYRDADKKGTSSKNQSPGKTENTSKGQGWGSSNREWSNGSGWSNDQNAKNGQNRWDNGSGWNNDQNAKNGQNWWDNGSGWNNDQNAKNGQNWWDNGSGWSNDQNAKNGQIWWDNGSGWSNGQSAKNGQIWWDNDQDQSNDKDAKEGQLWRNNESGRSKNQDDRNGPWR